jgi:chromate transporter
MDVSTTQPQSTGRGRVSPGELALLFLRLGATAFGGPAAHIAMMREEVVGKRQWMTDTEFLDLVAATNFIPGPNSTELAIHIGHRMAGWRGLFVAGACFIVPAFLIVLAFAWTYVRYGALPQVGSVLYGIKPVIIAIVGMALWKLGWAALHSRVLVAVGIGSLIAIFAGAHELAVLFAAGALLLILRSSMHGTIAVIEPFSLQLLFFFFLKVGAVLFGSGYVLLAFLRTDLVERLGWLSESQLLDAVAVGQFTPGPVFTTATFIGYLLGDTAGAVLATVGIFLPAFFFVAVTAPILPKLRSSAAAGAFLDGLNAASFALMAAVSWHLGLAALMDIPTVIIGAISLTILLTTRVQSTWLILAGGIAGTIIHLF